MREAQVLKDSESSESSSVSGYSDGSDDPDLTMDSLFGGFSHEDPPFALGPPGVFSRLDFSSLAASDQEKKVTLTKGNSEENKIILEHIRALLEDVINLSIESSSATSAGVGYVADTDSATEANQSVDISHGGGEAGAADELKVSPAGDSFAEGVKPVVSHSTGPAGAGSAARGPDIAAGKELVVADFGGLVGRAAGVSCIASEDFSKYGFAGSGERFEYLRKVFSMGDLTFQISRVREKENNSNSPLIFELKKIKYNNSYQRRLGRTSIVKSNYFPHEIFSEFLGWMVANFLTNEPRESISKVYICSSIGLQGLYIKYFRAATSSTVLPSVGHSTYCALAISFLLGDFDVHNRNIVKGRRVDFGWSFYHGSNCHFVLQRAVLYQDSEIIYSKAIKDVRLVGELRRLSDLIIDQANPDSYLFKLIVSSIKYFSSKIGDLYTTPVDKEVINRHITRNLGAVNIKNEILYEHLYGNAIEMRFISFALECAYLIKSSFDESCNVSEEKKEHLRESFASVLSESKKFRESIKVISPDQLAKLEANSFTAYFFAAKDLFPIEPKATMFYRKWIDNVCDEYYKDLFMRAYDKAYMINLVRSTSYMIYNHLKGDITRDRIANNATELKFVASKSLENEIYIYEFLSKMDDLWPKKFINDIGLEMKEFSRALFKKYDQEQSAIRR